MENKKVTIIMKGPFSPFDFLESLNIIFEFYYQNLYWLCIVLDILYRWNILPSFYKTCMRKCHVAHVKIKFHRQKSETFKWNFTKKFLSYEYLHCTYILCIKNLLLLFIYPVFTPNFFSLGSFITKI